MELPLDVLSAVTARTIVEAAGAEAAADRVWDLREFTIPDTGVLVRQEASCGVVREQAGSCTRVSREA